MTVQQSAHKHTDHEVVILGAGVAGICQLYRLQQLGIEATVLEGGADLGGTWFWNRYPGCRFDSESYTYGYTFSQELLDEWDWKEHFSGQPDNLRYLNYVADKFDLRKHMQFNCKVVAAHYEDEGNRWRIRTEDGHEITCRFLITCVGLLSAPTLPRIEGMEDFEGQSFHTYHWPQTPVDLAGKRVAVIGTGATAVQLIAEIADKVGDLTVFQRRPNWCAPLNNAPISTEEMAEIRARYPEIFEICNRTPGGFVHEPDRRGFYDVAPEERREFWDQLYGGRGFGIWLGNFREIFMDEAANADFSEYIAERIRKRVKDPVTAETLIPKDHGFGIQRVPMETRFYEAFNRLNVHLVNLQETPLERITRKGVRTSAGEYEFDIIVYATGFDAVTGAFDRIDIRGTGGRKLRDKWADGPVTFLGILVSGFPNLVMIAGPQSASSSTNFPRGIEMVVDWVTPLLEHTHNSGYTRVEVTPEAEIGWTEHVKKMYSVMLMRKAKGWFTGYNSNVPGHEHGKIRYVVYNGGTPKYRTKIAECTAAGYRGIDFRP